MILKGHSFFIFCLFTRNVVEKTKNVEMRDGYEERKRKIKEIEEENMTFLLFQKVVFHFKKIFVHF